MAKLIVTDADALKDLTANQINALAESSLSWDCRYVGNMRANAGAYWGVHDGHYRFKDSGHPVEFDGKSFSNRRAYLTHRLQKRIKATGSVYNLEGKVEAVAAAKLKREAAKQALKDTPQIKLTTNVVVRIGERIPKYAAQHEFMFRVDGNHVVIHKAKGSKGNVICDERIYLKLEQLAGGIQILKDNREVLESLPSIDVKGISGVTVETPTQMGIKIAGSNPKESFYSSKSDTVLNWDESHRDHVLISVQDWSFRLHIDDLSEAVDALTREYNITPIPEVDVAS